ncbi:DUF2490 domain-containing protein [Cyclobacterium jeungdonense]|uniref:DUF2490 domain-containing protein n=1 Tax=Cyclobacterium jeungdonense TaxID=708087 RepID=A0ABT8CD43_9BACT|nr:DUF2490 domain-containing protein [Cyclobacterium jeungdonense]MDN3690431.1 DUF2490 domain-containing protein [Cyclobacterium jeungdonense]
MTAIGKKQILRSLCTVAFCMWTSFSQAQYMESKAEDSSLPEKKYTRQSGLWLGMYTKYKIGEKLFYYGEYHMRRRDHLINNMAQIYLRFGLSYLVNEKFEVTGGIVTPFYWAPEGQYSDEEQIDKVVNQFRFWQQFLFIQSMGRVKIYHQIRIEQRWKRDYIIDSPFKLTHRMRYKISTYIPLNKPKLQDKTLFFSGYNEIFIQAGKPVLYNYFEDNRLFLGLGYVINENFQLQAGYMKSIQQRERGFDLNNRDIIRFSVYHNLDFTKRKKKPKNQEIDPIL